MRHLSLLLRLTIVITLAACGITAPPLAGTELGRDAAPDFALQDGLSGQGVSLASLRGKAVVLTFLYTQCPDSCPLTAELLRVTQLALGADAARVELVAVSVDPERDTPAAVRTFSEAHRLSTNWRYLIGRREQLAPVWASYGVRSSPDEGARTVTHSDALFIIDPAGKERRLLHTNDGSATLTAGVREALR